MLRVLTNNLRVNFLLSLCFIGLPPYQNQQRKFRQINLFVIVDVAAVVIVILLSQTGVDPIKLFFFACEKFLHFWLLSSFNYH